MAEHQDGVPRELDLVVVSDVHLGTYGCQAKEFLVYLKSIRTKILVLNGDIIDIWQFSKNYWPKSHMKVVRHLLQLIGNGVEVYYITGNHDEMLRKFTGFELGKFKLEDKVVLQLEDGKKVWIFHGDVFDVTMQHAKWLARLGAIGYDTLILINSLVNFIAEKVFKKGKISLSAKIKNSVKSAVSFINNFEQVTADIGLENGYDYVICGHIHQPVIKHFESEKGKITYMNSGDWVENLTALEYSEGKWELYRHTGTLPQDEEEEESVSSGKLFDKIVAEIKSKPGVEAALYSTNASVIPSGSLQLDERLKQNI